MAKKTQTPPSAIEQFRADTVGSLASTEALLRGIADAQLPASPEADELIAIRTTLGMPDRQHGPVTHDTQTPIRVLTSSLSSLVDRAKHQLEVLAIATERRLAAMALEGREDLISLRDPRIERAACTRQLGHVGAFVLIDPRYVSTSHPARPALERLLEQTGGILIDSSRLVVAGPAIDPPAVPWYRLDDGTLTRQCAEEYARFLTETRAAEQRRQEVAAMGRRTPEEHRLASLEQRVRELEATQPMEVAQ